MMTLPGFSSTALGHGLVHALGWTLLHFCWQGALVAGLLWCVLALTGDRAVRARYGAACVALLLMAALPLATFARLAAMETRGGAPVLIPALVLDVTADGSGGAKEPLRQRIAEGLDAAAAWIPAVWGVGLLLFLGRLNYGLIVAGRLKSKGTDAVPAALLETFERLKLRLGVQRAVRLVQSAMVQVPTVIGWLRPVVLVPMGCFLGLSVPQVEALLAHELAHVRRHDYLVSVLQSVVEALLFYHPAVWWVSRQVRRERECCCDELAVGVGGDALAYARALTSLEEYRAAMPAMVLSANGGVLTMRIRRLLGGRENSAVSQVAAFLILSVVMGVAGSYVVTAARAQSRRLSIAAPVQEAPEIAAAAHGELAFVPPPAPFGRASTAVLGQADPQSPPMKPQYKTWLEQDVRWIITDPEARAFLGLTNDEERDAFIANFWERRDAPGSAPNSFKELYYARMAYANEHFATDTKAGWKTDRGHIYLAYGKPHDVDSHPSGGGGSPYPSETWHYPSIPGIGDNVDIHFVDTCQCGDYHYTIDSPGHPVLGPGAGNNGQGGVGARVALARRILGPSTSSSGSPTAVPQPVEKGAEGAIAGIIADPTGAVVPRASVKATNTAGGLALARATDTSGSYSLPLPAGSYNVEVSAPGFQRASLRNVRVDSGKTVGVNLKLKVGSVSQNLTIAAAPTPPPAPLDQTFTPSPPAPGRPVRVSAGIASGMAISQTQPVYPEIAKAAHVQGVVVLHAIISKQGSVEQLQVVSGPPMLVSSALDAVRQWTYQPYLLNGEPTAVETTINVNYTFGEASPTETEEPDYAGVPVRTIGAGVSAPVPIYEVEPEFSAEARAAKSTGVVVVRLIVDAQGVPRNVQVMRGVGNGLDEKAVEAVKQYRFKPAMEAGMPVPVQLNVEVNFKYF